MPGTTRYQIEAESGDTTLVNGAPVEDPTITSSVVLALRMERGSCPMLPDFGSRLHTLKKATSDALPLAVSYTREALAHLIAAGKLPGLTITPAIRRTASLPRLHLVIEYRGAGGEVVAITYAPRLGAGA